RPEARLAGSFRSDSGFQRLQPAVADAELAQVRHRVEQVVAAPAHRPSAGREKTRHRLVFESGHVALVLAIGAERNRRLRALRRVRGSPYRAIGHGGHLAPPQDIQLGRGRAPGQAVSDAGAAAARHQREHQPGPLRAAAAGARPEAELAVESVDARRAPLDEMERRIPDQGAEGKYPDAPRARRARKDRFDLGGALAIGHEAHVRAERAAHRGVERAVEKAFSRKFYSRHRTRILTWRLRRSDAVFADAHTG